ncbi:MAG: carbohydrate porin [Gammaproteobacteria bacterium]|nr:carbohydrate porin [Gammaproteobacteria bacterium]
MRNRTLGERILVAAAALLGAASPIRATDADPAGLLFKAIYDGDLWTNLDGGRRTGTDYAAHLDLSVAIDGDRLWQWRRTQFYFRGFADSGTAFSRRVGDIHGINNWESGVLGGKLLEAWVDHGFNAERSSFRFGLYDTTTEFDKNKSEVLFIDNSQGMNRPLSLSGLNGPSTYSATSLGLRLRHTLDPHWTLKAAVLAGAPDDPADPTATTVKLRASDGAFAIGELRYHDPNGHRIALGFWRYTANFDQFAAPTERAPRGTGNQGFYVSGDVMLTSAADDPLRGISAGLRVAHATAEFNRFDWFLSGVITDVGFLESRPTDKVGLGFVYSHTGSPYRQVQRAQELDVRAGEVTVELTYRAPLGTWLSLQPDLQYVIHPADAPASRNALVFGLRMEVLFSRGVW